MAEDEYLALAVIQSVEAALEDSPVFGLGTFKEPLLALGISGIWGIYGAIYFIRSSKAKGKAILLAK